MLQGPRELSLLASSFLLLVPLGMVSLLLGEGRRGTDHTCNSSDQLQPTSSLFLQYLGSRTSEKVKSKILELMYSWTLGLPHEVKISEAYQMLKKQGERQWSGRGRRTDSLPSLFFHLGRI